MADRQASARLRETASFFGMRKADVSLDDLKSVPFIELADILPSPKFSELDRLLLEMYETDIDSCIFDCGQLSIVNSMLFERLSAFRKSCRMKRKAIALLGLHESGKAIFVGSGYWKEFCSAESLAEATRAIRLIHRDLSIEVPITPDDEAMARSTKKDDLDFEIERRRT